MTTRADIEKQLEAARADISRALAEDIMRRDALNQSIKDRRAELEALPKLAVRRTRKSRVVDTVHLVLEPADQVVTAVERDAHAAEAEWEGEP